MHEDPASRPWGSLCGVGPGTCDFLAVPDPRHPPEADLGGLARHPSLPQVGWSLGGCWASPKPQLETATRMTNPARALPARPSIRGPAQHTHRSTILEQARPQSQW